MPTFRLSIPRPTEGDQTTEQAVSKSFDYVDALFTSVKDRHLSAPPSSPSNGDAYIVGPSPTGDWSGKADQIALFLSDTAADSAGWKYITPSEGLRIWADDEDLPLVYDGAQWVNDRASLIRLADCTAAEAVGHCVYVSGNEVSGRVQVLKCDPTDAAKLPAWGIVIEKPTTTTALVLALGEVDGASWSPALSITAGASVYVGTDARPTTTAPTAAGTHLAPIGVAHDDTKFVFGNRAAGGVPAPDGSAAVPSIPFAADTDTGLFRPTSNTIGMSVGGTERARVEAFGVSVTDGGLMLAERAAQPTSDAAGKAQLWLTNDSDQRLILEDDQGNERIAAGPDDFSGGVTSDGIDLPSKAPKLVTFEVTGTGNENAIRGGRRGQVVILWGTSGAVINDGSGTDAISTPGDASHTLNTGDTWMGVHDGTQWHEISRSDN